MARITPISDVRRRLFNGARLHRRRKGDQRLGRRKPGSNLRHQIRHLEGLHASRIKSDWRTASRLLVVTSTPHCVLKAAHGRRGPQWRESGRRKKVLLQEGLQQDAAYLAGAQNGHADVGQLCGYFGGLNAISAIFFPLPGFLFWTRVVQLTRILEQVLRSALCQGTTSVVPKMAKNKGFSP